MNASQIQLPTPVIALSDLARDLFLDRIRALADQLDIAAEEDGAQLGIDDTVLCAAVLRGVAGMATDTFPFSRV